MKRKYEFKNDIIDELKHHQSTFNDDKESQIESFK